MDEKTAEKLLKRAGIAANRMGFGRDREDIAQEVLCRMLAGKNQHSTINQAVIDVLRERAGRKGESSFDARKNLYYANYLGPEEPLDSLRNRDGTNLDARLDFKRMAELLRGEERAFMMLRHHWGMNEIEIGDLFGVSESRIYQRLKSIYGRLSARAQKTAGSERARTGEVENLGEKQRQGLPREATQGMEKEAPGEMEAANGSCFSRRLT